MYQSYYLTITEVELYKQLKNVLMPYFPYYLETLALLLIYQTLHFSSSLDLNYNTSDLNYLSIPPLLEKIIINIMFN